MATFRRSQKKLILLELMESQDGVCMDPGAGPLATKLEGLVEKSLGCFQSPRSKYVHFIMITSPRF